MAAEKDIDIIVRDEFFPAKRLWFLPERRKKVIVEIGAARPDYLSISASFRQLGWQVIAVEPNPAFCAAHRAMGYEVMEYACGEDDRDDVDFFVVDSKGANYMGGNVTNESFSSLGLTPEFAAQYETVRDKASTTTIKVKVRKLDTILLKHYPKLRKIDVLAVDVEGWELQVMRGFSLEKYRPKVVILENNFDGAEYRLFMADRGYQFWQRLTPNDVFVRADMA